ncbi:MAG: protein phosphatase 2C domain-containing protein [Candidatus Rokuibacteriota bacterium]
MIVYSARTDIGRRRPLNEDAILAEEGLLILCDGMGGHKAGEVAAKLAVDTIAAFVRRSGEDPELTWPYGFDPHISYNGNRLRTAVKLANRTVFRKAASADEYTGMGTTVVAVMVSPSRRPSMTYTHVGDSRIYLVRKGVILQLTRDDSWANFGWESAARDDAPSVNMKNVLTKALGARDEVDFEIKDSPLSEGDTLLLCSDGLTNMLADAQILDTIARGGEDLERACDDLVAGANAEGGRDNISVILARFTA